MVDEDDPIGYDPSLPYVTTYVLIGAEMDQTERLKVAMGMGRVYGREPPGLGPDQSM